MAQKLNSVPPNVKVMEVIITKRSEGAGTGEEPVRIVQYIHTLDGELIGRLDKMEEEEEEEERQRGATNAIH